MAVSKRLRYEVLRRDNHACRYCGHAAPAVKLTVDHVMPTTLGGSDDPSNLVTACADCNSGKTSSSPDAPVAADVEADALRWSAAMQRAAAIREQALAEEEKSVAWFQTVWTRYWIGSPEAPVDERIYLPRDHGWERSVLTFLGAGLDQHFLALSVATALSNRRISDQNIWRYFCGICWRELDRRREMAMALIQADDVEAGPDGP